MVRYPKDFVIPTKLTYFTQFSSGLKLFTFELIKGIKQIRLSGVVVLGVGWGAHIFAIMMWIDDDYNDEE
jgi:hypothetical protein